MREHGVEQFVRDVRISQIYEGTNGVQALDLVGRKLPAQAGRVLRPFFHTVSALLEEMQAVADEPLSDWRRRLQQAFGALQLATEHIAQQGMADPEEAGAAASDYLRMLGLVGMGYCFLKSARIATARISEGSEEAAFYRGKLATANFFFDRILPQAGAALAVIKSGKASLMVLPAEAF